MRQEEENVLIKTFLVSEQCLTVTYSASEILYEPWRYTNNNNKCAWIEEFPNTPSPDFALYFGALWLANCVGTSCVCHGQYYFDRAELWRVAGQLRPCKWRSIAAVEYPTFPAGPPEFRRFASTAEPANRRGNRRAKNRGRLRRPEERSSDGFRRLRASS